MSYSRAMTTERALLTAEDLLDLPEDCTRQELVKGELITMTPPGGVHGETATHIILVVGPHVRAGDLGRLVSDVGFVLSRDPDTVRATDVAFISTARLPQGGLPEGYIEGAPDLAIEVVSPGDRAGQVQAKVQEWLEAGSRQVWVFYPRTRSIEVHGSDGHGSTLREGDSLTGGDVLPGFSCPVRDLFP